MRILVRLRPFVPRPATRGPGRRPTAYRFAITRPTPRQLDGELRTLDAAAPVRVEMAPATPTTVA